MELNTLKDLDIKDFPDRKGMSEQFAELDELRQTAFEHILKLNTNRSSNTKYTKTQIDGIVDWINYFFNVKIEEI